MQLIIAEKPSVARTLADTVGAVVKHDGYLEGAGYLVSWCIGHLVDLAEPDAYDERYAHWRYEDLPMIPQDWRYTVVTATKDQYAVLQKLMHDPRVDGIICATDAGREGELIFRLVYEQAKCKLPVKRLWISSLEQTAIRSGLCQMKDGSAYDNLYRAAVCRERADWLVGMNCTRLFSLLYGQTLKVGRVMTPTLSMIVRREEAVRAFKPEHFYTVQISTGFISTSDRFSTREEAEQLMNNCMRQSIVVRHIERKEKIEKPPKLYDLTTLQRDANRIFGYTAQQTLDYAQSLYEKQLITYPRTDSRFLTTDMAPMLPELVDLVTGKMPCVAAIHNALNFEQVINDKGVSDHHAIIPTQAMPHDLLTVSHLMHSERDILNLICIRLICAVADPYIYDETTVTVECCGHTFTAKGKTVRQIGWQAQQNAFRGSLGNRANPREREYPIPSDLTEGRVLGPIVPQVKEGVTTAPQRFTEDSLLAAMGNAGADEMPDDAEHMGIGTPATRAGILEKLVQNDLMQRQGEGKTKHLVPTEKGAALIAVVPEMIQSATLTADWELRLKEIEHGEADPDAFMADIIAMLRDLTQSAERVPNADTIFSSTQESLGNCPHCGAPVSESGKGFFCQNRACRFGIWKDSKFFVSKGKTPDADMVRTFLQDGRIHLTGLKSQKTKKTYDATMLMTCTDTGMPQFQMVFS